MTLEKATLGGGCFWCLEAIYQQLKGVTEVVSGYAGGRVENPSYLQVCDGLTGHAEVIQITFDPEVISYREIQPLHFLLTKLAQYFTYFFTRLRSGISKDNT